MPNESDSGNSSDEGNEYDDIDSSDGEAEVDNTMDAAAKAEMERTRSEREKQAAAMFVVMDKIRGFLRVRPSFKRQSTQTEDEWDSILRIKEIHMSCFSMLGILTTILLSYFKWYQRCDPDALGDCWADRPVSIAAVAASASNSYRHMQNVFAVLVVGQIVISMSSLVVLVLLIQYYGLKLQERQREWSGISETDRIEASGPDKVALERFFRASYRFWNSSYRWQFLLEVLLHCFYPVIWFESFGTSGETVEEVAECFVFCRLYLLLRLAYVHSDTYVLRASIIVGNDELHRQGYHVTPFTTFKIAVYRHPVKMILFATLIVLLVFSFCIFVVERNNNPRLSDLPTCIWFVWETISTVGYGEVTAVSPTGRTLVIICSTVMQFVMILFGGIVTNLLSPTREQKHVQRFLEQRTANKQMEKAAVLMLEIFYLEYRKKQERHASLQSYETRRSPKMYEAICRMKVARQAIRESLGVGSDSVIDEKLRDVIALGNDINVKLHEQGLALLFLYGRVMKATSAVRQRLTMGSANAAVTGTVKFEKIPKTDNKKYPYKEYVRMH